MHLEEAHMIDYELLIISVTSLLFFVIVGGTILLFPLARKLGHLIEARTREPRDATVPDDAGIRRIVARLETMEEQLGALTERQEFLERLLTEQRPTEAIGRGGGA
jgi:hypothetical protein